MSRRAEHRLSILTWNILAPCYFQTATHGRSVRCEAQLRFAWERRLSQQLAILRELGPDIVCLQELWFKPDVFRLLRAAIGDEYVLHCVQRAQKKEDGVALLVRRTWSTVDTQTIVLRDSNRVTVMACIEPAARAGHANSPLVVVASTHLLYPHDAADTALRLVQARDNSARVLQFANDMEARRSRSSAVSALAEAALSSFGEVRGAGGGGTAAPLSAGAVSGESAAGAGVLDDAAGCGAIEVELAYSGSADCADPAGCPPHPSMPVFLVGDFNHDSDPALQHLRMDGWQDVGVPIVAPPLAAASVSAASGGEDIVTHCNHDGEQVHVDFIFLYAPMSPSYPSAGLASPLSAAASAFAPTRAVHPSITLRGVTLLPGSVPATTRMVRPVVQRAQLSRAAAAAGAGVAPSSLSAAGYFALSPAARAPLSTASIAAASSSPSEHADTAASHETSVDVAPDFAVPRPIASLSFAEWCCLSDHRPLLMEASVAGEAETPRPAAR